MTPELKNFIQENKDLINQNSKESWEEIYSKLEREDRGKFTEVMLSAKIDPSEILEYIPNGYLSFSKLRQYKILDRVTSIGDDAFTSCKLLASIEIPDSVTSIGNGVFWWDSNLTSVTIGNSVTSIGKRAFCDCKSLTNITIPSSVTSIGDDAFSECSSLTNVYTTDIAAWCSISFGNGQANPLYYAKNLYLNNELVTELIIPDRVTSIGNNALYWCKSLKSVTIPDSVTSIGSWAFSGCSSLTGIFFNGTKAQWSNIRKSPTWANFVPVEKVVCSDGVIEF